MDTPNLLLGMVALIASASTFLAMGSLFWFTRRRRSLPDYTPPVTILKPLKGLDEDLEANLRSFFALDYPEFQLLFGVADPDDPAIPVVQKLLAEYPEQDARLVVGAPPFGLNPKVENMAALMPYRRHDVILISDSNVRAKPSYLRETACYLANPRVGLVTNIFVGVGEKSLGATLENLLLNGFVAGNFATAFAMGITCVVGKSMLLRVEALEAIGGLGAFRNLLAEDQAIAVKIRKAGYKIALSHHVIENVNESRDLKWFLNRHSRWLKIRYQMARPAFLLEPLANLTAVGLVWALSGDSGLAWGGLLLLAGLGIARDAIQTRWLRGSFPKARNLLLCPVKDLFLLPIWFDALLSRKIHWRGHSLVVGRFTRLRRVPAHRQARQRGTRHRGLHSNEFEESV